MMHGRNDCQKVSILPVRNRRSTWWLSCLSQSIFICLSIQHFLGRFLARLKQPFSKEIKQILIENGSSLLEKPIVRERPDKQCFGYWQEGPGFDRNIFSPEAIQASIDYIHINPPKRGLCRRAVDWKCSSARYYLAKPPVQQFEELPLIHGKPLSELSANHREGDQNPQCFGIVLFLSGIVCPCKLIRTRGLLYRSISLLQFLPMI